MRNSGAPYGTASAQSDSYWRKTISIAVLVSLAFAAYQAVRWVWRDITYWSMSTTVAYSTASIDECLRRIAEHLPELSVSTANGAPVLQMPSTEGLMVKATSTPQVARLVVFGHSASISRLGPPSEESVRRLLNKLNAEVEQQCAEP